MLKLLRFSHSTSKHQMNWYLCSYCEQEVVRRRRKDQHDSCGCQMRRGKHGHERNRKPTPELKCYRKMVARCRDPNDKSYKHYGARGIYVDSRWLNDVNAFLKDMGPRPSNKHSIERLDVNGPYAPENCVWATKYVQARNTTANVHVTIEGRTEIITDWLRYYNLDRSVFYKYMKHQGCDHKTALLALLSEAS